MSFAALAKGGTGYGGDLLVEGTVESLTYEEEEPHQSLFGRLFRG